MTMLRYSGTKWSLTRRITILFLFTLLFLFNIITNLIAFSDSLNSNQSLAQGVITIGSSHRHHGFSRVINALKSQAGDCDVQISSTELDGIQVICVLYPNGNITIQYDQIDLESISDCCKTGLSDEYDYAINDTKYLELKKTSYSKIEVPKQYMKSSMRIEYTPNPTCIEQTTCEACMANSNPERFVCFWCPKLNRCSDGYDQQTPRWEYHGCNRNNITVCPIHSISNITESYSPWPSNRTSPQPHGTRYSSSIPFRPITTISSRRESIYENLWFWVANLIGLFLLIVLIILLGLGLKRYKKYKCTTCRTCRKSKVNQTMTEFPVNSIYELNPIGIGQVLPDDWITSITIETEFAIPSMPNDSELVKYTTRHTILNEPVPNNW